MEPDPLTPPKAAVYRLIASPWHTLLVLAMQGFLAFRGKIRTDQMRAVVNPDRLGIYERTIFFEWLVFVLVIVGVWWSGSSLYTVLGERWRSLRQFLQDIGIGVLFLIAVITVDSIIGPYLRGSAGNHAAQFILPHGSVEMTWWVGLSITAGICEETLYRGYLQRQFIALSKSIPAGIVFSAVAFGAAHSYQGFRHAAQIGVLGAMAGVLAHWRKSVRPGMIAHSLQDVLGGIIQH